MENGKEIEAEFEKKLAYPSIQQGWGILGLFIVISLAFSIPIALLRLFGLELPGGPTLFFSYSIPLLVLILVTRYWWKRNPLNHNQLSFKSFPFELFPAILIICVSLMFINGEIVSWMPMPEFIKEIFKDFVQPNAWGFATIAIAAAILEEVLFRGIVLEGLLRNYHPWRAILWSALFFGIFHLNPWQFVVAFLLGTAIGYLYWKTRSIWVGVLIHFINNATAFVLGIYYPEEESFSDLFELGLIERILLFVLAGFLVWQCYRFTERYFKAKANVSTEPLE